MEGNSMSRQLAGKNADIESLSRELDDSAVRIEALSRELEAAAEKISDAATQVGRMRAYFSALRLCTFGLQTDLLAIKDAQIAAGTLDTRMDKLILSATGIYITAVDYELWSRAQELRLFYGSNEQAPSPPAAPGIH